MTTNKTFKQISKVIEDKGRVNAVESMYFSRTRCSEAHRVEIDGEWYSVSTASWNKLWRNFRFKSEIMDEKPGTRHVSYVFSVK